MATNQQRTIVELPHDLTPDEQLELQNNVMTLLDIKQALAAEMVSKAAAFKRDKADIEKREKDNEAEINRVRGEIKVGRELRKYTCNVIRDREAKRVDYVVAEGPLQGQVIKTHAFTQADWEYISDNSQSEIPFDGELDDENDEQQDGEPQDLRAQADLTATGPLQPNVDTNGYAVAGADTDAYNQANPSDPTYQHLSEQIDFEPAVVGGTQEDGGAAEQADDDQGDDSDGGDDENDDDSDDNGDEPEAPTPPAPKPRPARKKPTPAAK